MADHSFLSWSSVRCSSLQSCHWPKGMGCFSATLVDAMVSSRTPLLPSAALLDMSVCAIFLCCSASCFGVCLCSPRPKAFGWSDCLISFCVTLRSAKAVYTLCIREIGRIALSIFIHSSVPPRTDRGLGLGIIYQLDNLFITVTTIIIISVSYFDLVLCSVIAS